MPKSTEKEVTTSAPAKTEQEIRWEKFLETYKKQNPEKYAQRELAGELVMPVDF